MNKIFIGMLFIFFNFTITINNSAFGLIPDFVGYLLMLSGTKELISESECFPKVRPVLIVLFVLSLLFYIADLFGLSMSANSAVILLINCIAVIGSLYSSYMITYGVIDMEKHLNIDLEGEKLMYKWKVKAMFCILAYLVIFIPIISLICMLVSFIISIFYLINFNRSKNAYERAQHDL